MPLSQNNKILFLFAVISCCIYWYCVVLPIFPSPRSRDSAVSSRRVLILCNSTSIFSLQKLAPFSWLRQTQCHSDLGGHRLGAARAEEAPTARAERHFSNSCLVVCAPPGDQLKRSISASMRCLPLHTLQSLVRVGWSLEWNKKQCHNSSADR